MSRKAGTPNKKKVEYPIKDIPVTTLNENYPQEIINRMKQKESDRIALHEKYSDGYIILARSLSDDLSDCVSGYLMRGYECQGGVSVTNYRANDGNIVMVYCQALIKKG